jgi:hypothetical protein
MSLSKFKRPRLLDKQEKEVKEEKKVGIINNKKNKNEKRK